MQPKHLLFAALFSSTVLAAHAQFKKGDRMPGASIGSAAYAAGRVEFSGVNQTGSLSKSNNFSLGLSPSMGWFLGQKTAAGGSLLINYTSLHSSREVSGTTNQKDNSSSIDFGVGGFVRHYLGTANALKPFVHFYLNGGSGSSKSDGVYYFYANTLPPETVTNSYTGKSSGRFFYNAGLNLGVTRLLTESVGLEGYIGYGHTHTQTTNKTTQTTHYSRGSIPDSRGEYESKQVFKTNGVNLGIGLQVFLHKK